MDTSLYGATQCVQWLTIAAWMARETSPLARTAFCGAVAAWALSGLLMPLYAFLSILLWGLLFLILAIGVYARLCEFRVEERMFSGGIAINRPDLVTLAFFGIAGANTLWAIWLLT